MDEVIVSKFTNLYYAKIIGFGVLVASYIAVFVFQAIRSEMMTLGNTLPIIVICPALVFFYFYTLLRICKRITLTTTEITVDYLIFKKQLSMSYSDVESANTYRSKLDDGTNNFRGLVNYQRLVIEFKNGKSISLSAGDYYNYDELKAAIYKYKYGIG